MKNITIGKKIAGLTFIAALPFIVRSCSIVQSNHPYMQGEYKGAKYSFANNGITGKTYTIALQDGTTLRCDDRWVGTFITRNIIDSVIEYDKDGKISKVYKNSLITYENDEFLSKLTDQVKEADQYIRKTIEERQKQPEQPDKEQSELLKKLNEGKIR